MVTLVTCENWQGCEICDFCGNGAGFGSFFCLRLRPGTLKLIFSGSLINRSMAVHISCAASFESKLNPITLVWSLNGTKRNSVKNFCNFSHNRYNYLPLDRHIVWNAGPATRYADKLSIVSCHSAKLEPRSAKMNVTRGTHRERAEPLSCNKTGTPVYFRRHSFLFTLSYKFANDGQTYTWKLRKKTKTKMRKR